MNPIKIAFIGYKGTGKDTLLKGIQEIKPNLERLALGDILKEKSIDGVVNNNFNYNYLLEDFLFVQKAFNTKNEDLIKNIKKNQILMGVNIEGILKKEYSNLILSEKLNLIEIFKGIKELKTRFHLQIFGDYYKNKKKNNFIFSNILAKKIKDKNIENYVITDIRFLSELLAALEEGVLVLFLYNNSIISQLDIEKEHLSEQLALSNQNIGIRINVEGTKSIKSPKGDTINFLDKDNGEFENKVIEVINILNNFNGYSKDFISNILKIKNELIKDQEYKKIEEDYIKNYKYYINGEVEYSLLYNNYNKFIKILNSKYLSKIESLLSKELNKT